MRGCQQLLWQSEEKTAHMGRSHQMRVWECFEYSRSICLPPSFLLDDTAENHFSPVRKWEAIIMLLFCPKPSPSYLHHSRWAKASFYTGGFPVLSFWRIKLMKHSQRNSQSKHRQNASCFLFYVSRFFKKGEERKEGSASNDRCYIFALRTNVFFMNGSPIRPHHPNARMWILVTACNKWSATVTNMDSKEQQISLDKLTN